MTETRGKAPDINRIIPLLREACKEFEEPIVTKISKGGKDPFQILVSTVLSARTKDIMTRKAANNLFARASTPERIKDLDLKEIEELIRPAGFYKNKARSVKDLCRILVEEFNGRTPDELDELLKLPGVGRKTANLVLTLGFNKLGICVDTHVHRISNRLGYVQTKSPEQTEMTLRKKLPKRYWIEYNDLLVTYGQNICKPVSPLCSKCVIEPYCSKVGVAISR
jgi:endonuclease-3